jgi:hypothetical protein
MRLCDLTVSRLIPAPPGDVFDVWLDPKSPGGPWYGCARLIIEPKVDGLFYHAVEHEGRTWPHYGRFVASSGRVASSIPGSRRRRAESSRR